tara:strand:- start:340 stop:471 length:132 start_codon:yes stop_codon:yes gene_type:complete
MLPASSKEKLKRILIQIAQGNTVILQEMVYVQKVAMDNEEVYA